MTDVQVVPAQAEMHVLTVMVLDLVDSVRLMQQDESQAIQRWTRFVDTVRLEIAPRHAGQITRSLGDSLLLVFQTPPDAVAASIEIHRQVALLNQGLPGEQRMQVRQGLHAGAVRRGELDIYGTAVNLAARVMALAGPGETWVSSEVRDAVVDGLDAGLEDLGDFFLKGFPGSTRLYRIGLPGSRVAVLPLNQRLANVMRPGMAVLPFTCNWGSDQAQLIGEALAEELIAQLARLSELHVISSLSTRGLKGRQLSLQELVAHLGVTYVVWGRYQLDGTRLRLQVELVDGRSGQVLWTDTLVSALDAVFVGEQGLVGDITHQIATAVLDREVDRAITQPLPALESYTLLFGAMTLMHRPARRDFERARLLIEELAYRHGRDGVAHAWLAKWHVLRAAQGWSPDLASEGLQARNRVGMALDADPSNALALAIGGHVQGFFFKDAAAAGRLYRDALAANPSEPLAWLYSCTWHAYRGEAEQAEEAAALALRLSPLDPMKYYFQSFAATALLAGQHAQRSEQLARQSICGQRGHASTWRTLAYALVLQDRVDEARAAVQHLLAIEPAYTVSAFRARFPGRDGPMAEPFARALSVAGLPE